MRIHGDRLSALDRRVLPPISAALRGGRLRGAVPGGCGSSGSSRRCSPWRSCSSRSTRRPAVGARVRADRHLDPARRLGRATRSRRTWRRRKSDLANLLAATTRQVAKPPKYFALVSLTGVPPTLTSARPRASGRTVQRAPRPVWSRHQSADHGDVTNDQRVRVGSADRRIIGEHRQSVTRRRRAAGTSYTNVRRCSTTKAADRRSARPRSTTPCRLKLADRHWRKPTTGCVPRYRRCAPCDSLEAVSRQCRTAPACTPRSGVYRATRRSLAAARGSAPASARSRRWHPSAVPGCGRVPAAVPGQRPVRT